MATVIRPKVVPQCSACLQRIAWMGSTDGVGIRGTTHQQVRWARRMPNNSATVTVKLRKDMPTYGKQGAIVPVVTGQMRNIWFPRGIADYVTRTDLKVLRKSDVSMERDYTFGVQEEVVEEAGDGIVDWVKTQRKSMSDTPEMRQASMFKKSMAEAEALAAERIVGLFEAFVPAKIEFYRQPIIDTAKEEPEDHERKQQNVRGASTAANDLLAARIPKQRQSSKVRQAIYGSVSSQDVLTAVKAVMAEHDEASRVVITSENIHFVNLPELDGTNAERIKHVGDFTVQIKPSGVEQVLRRTVRVIAQDG